MKNKVLLFISLLICLPIVCGHAFERKKYNFNSAWLLKTGDIADGQSLKLDDGNWKKINLPRAFNEDEAFKLHIKELSDTVMWYRKHFQLDNIKDKKVFIEFEGIRQGVEIMGPGSFIYANGENNIAVTGKGTIYGPPLDVEIRQRPNGNTVVENDIPVDAPVEKKIFDGMEGRGFYKPKTISPINCTKVLIEGITMERSTFWNVCPIYCENVIIRGITVNSVGIPSGDGIDIESCKNVLIEYCTLNCGDDCFTLKAGRGEDGLRVGKPTENVVIRYSLAQKGHGGITCGSETAGGVKNVYVHDCVFDGTQIGIRFKTRRNRAGGVNDALYEKIRMTNVGEAFKWDLLGSKRYVGELAERYPPRAINKLTPTIKDIHIKNFIVE